MLKSKSRKRIMRRFSIGEISSVDLPAQEDALAVIMKRKEPTMYDTSYRGIAFWKKYGNDPRTKAILRRAAENMAKREGGESFQKSKDAPSMERIVAALAALSSKIDAIHNEFGGKGDDLATTLGNAIANSDHRDRQIAFLEEEDEDISEDVKAAMTKFSRGHSTKMAALMAARRATDGTLAKAHRSGSNSFAKHVSALREANPHMSRVEAMRKARRDNPKAFAMAYR